MRRSMIHLGLVSGFSLALGGATVARAQNTTPSSASETTESAKDAIKGATQNSKDAVQQAGSATKEATKSAGEATKETAKSAGAKTKEAAHETGGMMSDSSVTTKLKVKLAADAPKGSDIHVETKNNVVTLTGTVDSEASRKRVLGITEHTSGVHQVKDELEIKPSK